MAKVLVLDGRSRATITIVRSLGKMGLEVDVGDEYRTYSTYSRYCSSSLTYPSADSNPEKFSSFLKKIIESKIYSAIIPVRDHTTKCLVELNNNGIYDNYLCLPLKKSYAIASSKSSTIKVAEELGIPHPMSLHISNTSNLIDIVKIVNENFSFPILLKPSFSSGSRGIIMIKSIDELGIKLNKFISTECDGIIQEYIPFGGSYGVELLYSNGKIKARFTHKRLREYPVNGGPSTCRCSYRFKEIEEYSTKLLDHLNWNGVAMVEYRVDLRTGVPKLMEINPRFWGSLAMAYHAGVDFPRLLFQLITKKDCEEVFDYNLNKQTRWILWGEVLWLLSRNRKTPIPKGFFNFLDPSVPDDIISKTDPIPTLGVLIDTFRTFFSIKKLNHIFNRSW